MRQYKSSVSPVQTQLISHFLREPLDVTRAHLRANASLLARLDKLRLYKHSRRVLGRHAQGIDVSQRDLFAALAREDRRSRIIASFHYGDYVYGLNALMALEPDSRRHYVITLKQGSRTYFYNLNAAFGRSVTTPENELLLAKLSLVKVSRLLRAGNRSLVLFCDLPPGYGARLELDFLGRRAQFGRGAATLAVANRVPILPVICVTGPRKTAVVIERQLEPDVRQGESRTAAIRRLTANLIGLLERHLIQDPRQWRYLSLLPAYFQVPGTIQEQP